MMDSTNVPPEQFNKPRPHQFLLLTIMGLSMIVGIILLVYSCSDNKTNESQEKKESLQFSTPSGHILNFGPSSLMIVSMDHMLKFDLVGNHQVDPVAAMNEPSEQSSQKKLNPFRKVTYPNVWPGITVVYEAKPGQIVKSTYQVAAKSTKLDIGMIRINYNRPLKLDGQGRLLIQYDMGEMIESAPTAWQVVNGMKIMVPVKFKLHTDKEVGFSIGNYDNEYPLIIDPSLR